MLRSRTFRCSGADLPLENILVGARICLIRVRPEIRLKHELKFQPCRGWFKVAGINIKVSF